MADLQAEGRDRRHRSQALEAIHRRKTGALLRAPLRMGAVVAGADESRSQALDVYGRAVGLAFQIVDDLLDVAGGRGQAGQAGAARIRAGQVDVPRVPRASRAAAGGPGSSPTRPWRRWRRSATAGRPAAGPGAGSSGKGSLMSSSAMLPRIGSPADLKALSEKELEQLAAEMRDELIGVVGRRSAHFASNLGVVELCLALHLTFDFAQDRLIWDTGHQIYPHKLITGRADRAAHDPDQGGPDGLPQPGRERLRPVHDRPRRLRPSTALGLKAGDDLVGHPERHSVAVIGDGAFPSGIVFEALNNAGGLQEEVPGHPQRQQDVDLPARRRPGLLPRQGADGADLQRLEQAGPQAPAGDPPGRRPGRPLAPADQGRDQGVAPRRDALRGAGLHLPRPDRRPRPEDPAQLPREGQGDGRAGPAPRPDRQGARLRAGR